MIKNIDKLKTMIRTAGITQHELATALKVGQPTVSRWMNGTRQLPLNKFFVIIDLIASKTGVEQIAILKDFVGLENA
tara:strand:+ start:718 stop:948 length:231 start_codon:yes stop_codon:yes gene_type:complete